MCSSWSLQLYLLASVLVNGNSSVTSGSHSPLLSSSTRPSLIIDALREQKPLYYFAVGSNLSRSKLENRAVDGNGGKINVMELEPAVVKGHRMAFNMKGFPPLEPVMASLEPVTTDTSDDGTQHNDRDYPDECHGALYLLQPHDFERVMQSEGIVTSLNTGNTASKNGSDSGNNSGYEEIVVLAEPYGGQPAVQAVSLRAAHHQRACRVSSSSRMNIDRNNPCPSPRYMELIREGARELKLNDSYQQWLDQYPVQVVPRLLQKMAVRNIMFMFYFGRIMPKIFSPFRKVQNRMLFGVYVPSVNPNRSALVTLLQHLSNILMGIILLPGAICGAVILQYYKRSGTLSPFMNIFIDRYG